MWTTRVTKGVELAFVALSGNCNTLIFCMVASDSMSSASTNNDDSAASASNDDNNNDYSMESDYEYESCSDFGGDEHDEAHLPHSLFNQDPASCPICCEDKVEEGCALILPSCKHSFCVVCFTSYVESQIGEGNADTIVCPEIIQDSSSNSNINSKGIQKCNAKVELEVLHEIMTEESYSRLKQQQENAFVRKNTDYHHCPTPDCTNIVLCKSIGDESEGKICDCFKCGQTSCLSCGASPFHTNLSCNEYQEQKRMRRIAAIDMVSFGRRGMMGIGRMMQPDRSRANEETRYDFHVTELEDGISNNNNNDANANASLLQNIKRCRRCGNGVELEDGCLKMKCICGYRFCYQCGAENAICNCTPAHHGFVDNQTGRGDFSGLNETRSYT